MERLWDIWGSYYNIPKAIFYLLKGGYRFLLALVECFRQALEFPWPRAEVTPFFSDDAADPGADAPEVRGLNYELDVYMSCSLNSLKGVI